MPKTSVDIVFSLFLCFLTGLGKILYSSQASVDLAGWSWTGPRGFQLRDNLLLISTTDYFRQETVIIAFFDPNA